MLRMMEGLRGHKYFFKAALLAVKSYIYLYDKPDAAEEEVWRGILLENSRRIHLLGYALIVLILIPLVLLFIYFSPRYIAYIHIHTQALLNAMSPKTRKKHEKKQRAAQRKADEGEFVSEVVSSDDAIDVANRIFRLLHR